MTVKAVIKKAKAQLSEAEIPSDRLDAELLLGHVIGRDRAWVLAHADEKLEENDQKAFFDLINRRSNREPLVHLTGTREFYGLDLEITPDVLTPRVETEQMVEWAIQYTPPNSRLIDIGTGSGAIAIAIAKNRPDLDIWASDVTPLALRIARRNAEAFKLNIKFIQSDLWQAINGSFQIVVTNLPYLKNDAQLMPEVRREPGVALFGGDDGLEIYRQFLQNLPKYLEPGGYLFTECDPWQQDDLIKEAKLVGLEPIERGYFIMGFKRI